jgi:hypothetical protein
MDHYTRGDAYLLRAATILGAYVPLAIVDLAGSESDKTYTAASMIGAAAGIGLGHHLAGGRDLTAGQGTLITLGELAGGLLGLGIAVLVSDDDSDNSALYLSSSALGAAVGFWSIYNSFKQQAETRKANFALDINILPQGHTAVAAGARMGDPRQSPGAAVRATLRF